MNIRMKSFLIKYKSLLALIVLCLVISIIQPRFLTISNISTVLTQVSMNAIIAIGMTFVILTGGIDLSVGSIIAITRLFKWIFCSKGKNSGLHSNSSNYDYF